MLVEMQNLSDVELNRQTIMNDVLVRIWKVAVVLLVGLRETSVIFNENSR
jgi:hypothetical protein